MNRKTKVGIAILVASSGFLLMLNHLFDKKPTKEHVDEVINTTFNSIPTTTTTTTKKVTTTKKKTTKKVASVKTASISEYQSYAKSYGGYDDTQMSCLIELWNRESGWNPNSKNKSTGACGIPQAYPCSKIKKSQGSNDWKAQIRWGIGYISARYTTPCKAWNHFKSKGWY